MRRFFSLFFFVLLLASVGAGTYAYHAFNTYMVEAGPTAAPTTVVLPRGAGLGAIVTKLDEAGVITYPALFKLAVRVQGHDRDLKAGEYIFEAAASPTAVIEKLAKGDTLRRRVTVTEGMTVAQVYKIIEAAEGLSGDMPPLPLEGTLLPETYLYSFGDSRASVDDHMQSSMTRALDKAWADRAEGLPFESKQEALIMASIVDRETGQTDEREQVAAVFVNRLRLGMRLQSDPTIIYGLTDGQGPLDRALTRQDWKLDHPYNTYRIDALPPGPIGNPGVESIEAVMRPADVDYLFFVADGTGGHAFAVTLDDHNANVARWRRIKAGTEPKPVMPSPIRPSAIKAPSSESVSANDR